MPKKPRKPTNQIELNPVPVNAGIGDAYASTLFGVALKMHRDYLLAIEAELLPLGEIQAYHLDMIRRMMVRQADKWMGAIDALAEPIATKYTGMIYSAMRSAMRNELKRAGFAVAYNPTPAQTAATRATLFRQVELIRTIPPQYHDKVEMAVYESIAKGFDMQALQHELMNIGDVTLKRAALIARDQTRKAKSVLEVQMQREIGVKFATWRHSGAGKEPRETHVDANGEIYDIEKGLKIDGKYIYPGWEINCRCQSIAIIEPTSRVITI